jgi:hypothetical protein
MVSRNLQIETGDCRFGDSLFLTIVERASQAQIQYCRFIGTEPIKQSPWDELSFIKFICYGECYPSLTPNGSGNKSTLQAVVFLDTKHSEAHKNDFVLFVDSFLMKLWPCTLTHSNSLFPWLPVRVNTDIRVHISMRLIAYHPDYNTARFAFELAVLFIDWAGDIPEVLECLLSVFPLPLRIAIHIAHSTLLEHVTAQCTTAGLD